MSCKHVQTALLLVTYQDCSSTAHHSLALSRVSPDHCASGTDSALNHQQFNGENGIVDALTFATVNDLAAFQRQQLQRVSPSLLALYACFGAHL